MSSNFKLLCLSMSFDVQKMIYTYLFIPIYNYVLYFIISLVLPFFHTKFELSSYDLEIYWIPKLLKVHRDRCLFRRMAESLQCRLYTKLVWPELRKKWRASSPTIAFLGRSARAPPPDRPARPACRAPVFYRTRPRVRAPNTENVLTRGPLL